MRLKHDLARADHIASYEWWKLAKYAPLSFIKGMETAYADLQKTNKKYKKAKHGVRKHLYRLWLKGEASRFVSEYGPICDLAAKAR